MATAASPAASATLGGWQSTRSPALAIRAAMPSVLRHTVLPPVLGPVMTTERTPEGTARSIGTISDGSGASEAERHTRRGWRSELSESPRAVHSCTSSSTCR